MSDDEYRDELDRLALQTVFLTQELIKRIEDGIASPGLIHDLDNLNHASFDLASAHNRNNFDAASADLRAAWLRVRHLTEMAAISAQLPPSVLGEGRVSH